MSVYRYLINWYGYFIHTWIFQNCHLYHIISKTFQIIKNKGVYNIMKTSNIQKLTIAALFAALTCVATMIIKIPTPGTGGYIHPGDALVILCGIFLGPIYGGLAAGLGSALADLLGGYFIYAPITFIIKGLVAVIVFIVYHKLSVIIKPSVIRCIICGIFSTLIVVSGYFLYEFFISGAGGAIASVPANIIQGASGLIISSILLPVLLKIPSFNNLKNESKF